MELARELDAAAAFLNTAMNRYANACSSLQGYCQQGTSRTTLSPELADRVSRELALVSSYENDIHYAKAIAGWASNLTGPNKIRSINSLPDEILTRIFNIVCTMHPCPASNRSSYSRSSPKYPPFRKDPIVLSHVCLRWRHITTGSGLLWSHIDLDPRQFRVPELKTRASTYLARAGLSPLDIHIEDSDRVGNNPSTLKASSGLIVFLTSCAPRTWKITIHVRDTPRPGGLFYQILSVYLSHCVPGILSHFSVRLSSPLFPRVHVPLMGLSESAAENLWLPVTTLRLKDFYPRFTSNIFYGLTELILARGGIYFIPQMALMDILRRSPKLQVLKIDLDITYDSPSGSTVAPVPLEDLEFLGITGVGPQFNILLSMIAPGPRPLTLSMMNPWLSFGLDSQGGPPEFNRADLEAFVARSHITRLDAAALETYSQVTDLLDMIPTVRVLALSGFACTHIENDISLPSPSPLHTLYVTCSSKRSASFSWACLERIVRRHGVHRLVLWKYDFSYNMDGSGEEAGIVPDNLYTVCPWVTVIPDQGPDPLREWD